MAAQASQLDRGRQALVASIAVTCGLGVHPAGGVAVVGRDEHLAQVVGEGVVGGGGVSAVAPVLVGHRVPLDLGDPKVVAIDTVTSDVIVTDDAQVSPYERLYQRIREAALSAEETAKLLTEAADALPDT